jgi:hypothetical protein
VLGHDLAPPSAARHAGKGRLLPHGPRVTLVAFVIALLAPQYEYSCKSVVDRAQICCCLPPDLKPEMGPRQSDSRIQSLRGEDWNNFLLGIYSGTQYRY